LFTSDLKASYSPSPSTNPFSPFPYPPNNYSAAAWDTVEELSAAVSHAKAAKAADPTSNDPLEKYCADNPDADECRVYGKFKACSL